MKDQSSCSRSSGSEWRDVSEHHRCPVCGSGSWCQVHRGGGVVLCKRIEGDRAKENRDGVIFHVHHLDGAPAKRSAPPPVEPKRQRAPAEACDRAYRALLSHLALDRGDRDGLRARGLDDVAIDANGYRSLPLQGRHRLALTVLDAVGEDVAAAVPGVVWKTEGRRGWWSLAGVPGMLIPVRDLNGRVVALKVRRREADASGRRYTYVSSRAAGGASAPSAVHVPVAAAAMRGRSPWLAVTEGELKSDISTALAGAPVVSIPGVGGWAAGVELALTWGARVVFVAMDMDFAANPRVAEARELMLRELRREGVDARLKTWPCEWKGFDDYLAAKRRGDVTCGR